MITHAKDMKYIDTRTMYTLYTRTLYVVQCSTYNVQCTYDVQYSIYDVHCTLYVVDTLQIHICMNAIYSYIVFFDFKDFKHTLMFILLFMISD